MAAEAFLTAKAETAIALKLVERKARAFGKAVGEEMKRELALTVFDAIKTLPPVTNLAGTESFGVQRRAGVAAAAADIEAVYSSTTEIFRDLEQVEGDADGARAFRKLAPTDPAAAEELLRRFGHPAAGLPVRPFEPGEHRAARGRDGRVRVQFPRVIVTDPARLAAYKRRKAANVGDLKSGFVSAYRALGGRKSIPAWITNNRGASRLEDRTKEKLRPTLAATNLVPFGGYQNRKHGIVRIVIARRNRKLRAQIAHGVRQKVRRG